MPLSTRSIAGLALPLALACGGRDATVSGRDSLRHSAVRPAASGVPAERDTVLHPDSLRVPRAPLVARPAEVRGLYVNRWAALGDRIWELIAVARRTEVNALVIDVKDDRGFVLYRSRVPLAREIGADTMRPMRQERVRAVLDSM
ncbi:MAG: hypothetical protein HOQ09_11220, partial [Gemmatimonadaceae bacterium]|nr:hypothetical protein [Gemmatimonadaceae bacterium]